MVGQEIRAIKIKDLVLWTENPRDPIDENASDQDIVNLALQNNHNKWDLHKLANDMGPFYDFSELPTVVYHGQKPIVYDGNRRMVLGKIKLSLVKVHYSGIDNIPDFPEEIYCNVCSKDIALKNILRKHGDSGSWSPLERDIFLNKFMNMEKSLFLVLEEHTFLISKNPHLNQRFVKEEILTEESLNKMGFKIEKGKLFTNHTNEEAYKILSEVSRIISNKIVTTRKERGKIIENLAPNILSLIEENKEKQYGFFRSTPSKENKEHEGSKANQGNEKSAANKKSNERRKTKRTNKNELPLFGGNLYLRRGSVSDLYRDISDLYLFFIDNKHHLSDNFKSLIRMALRLLCETAANEAVASDENKKLDRYIKDNFESGKKSLGQDAKTTLANHNVNLTSLVQLLHTGAHNYHAASNIEQTIAISIILGAMLTLTHGQVESK